MPDQPISNELLSRFPPEALAEARPLLRSVRLVSGQVLFEPGDEVDRVYFPERGLISLVTQMSDGHDVQNTARGRDGGVGYWEAIASGVSGSRALVQIAGTAWAMRASDFRTLYASSPSVREVVHRWVEFLLAEARQTIACQAVHPAEGRLARMLLERGHHTGETRFPLTQEFMADMVGVGRTTVTHSASHLKKLGLIRYSRGSVTLMDVPGLQGFTCECYRAIRQMRSRICGGLGGSRDVEPRLLPSR